MKVTDVTPQKNNTHRVSVFVDNEYAFSLDETDAVLLKIKVGRELTKADIDRCIMECNYTKARDKAFEILSRKPLCCKELEDKLFAKGYDNAIVAEVVRELEDLGYLSDTDYATLFLEHCRAKMWGKKKIRYEMKQKGIESGIIEDVLADIDEDDSLCDVTETIISKYGREDLTDMKVKAKITRYFASRGFDFSLIDKGIRRAIEVIDNE